MDDRDRFGTAFHEGGHAAMGLLSGRPPTSASTVREGRSAGAVTFDKDAPLSARSYFDRPRGKRIYLELRVMIEVAGTVAPMMEPGRDHDAGDEMDRAVAVELLRNWDATDDARTAWLDRLTSLTRTMLAANRTLVERISSALFGRNTLSRGDLLALTGGRRKPASEQRASAARWPSATWRTGSGG